MALTVPTEESKIRTASLRQVFWRHPGVLNVIDEIFQIGILSAGSGYPGGLMVEVTSIKINKINILL